MHVLQLGTTDSRLQGCDVTSEGLEPYYESCPVLWMRSFHQLIPVGPLSHARSPFQVGWVLCVLR